MTDLTAEIRARLEAAAPHLEGCEIQAVRREQGADWVPVRDLVRHAPADLRALLAEVERLQEALAALEDRPPAADAELLASANRALCERLEAAERLGTEHYEASVKALARAEKAERALSEARAEIAYLRAAIGGEREARAILAEWDAGYCSCKASERIHALLERVAGGGR